MKKQAKPARASATAAAKPPRKPWWIAVVVVLALIVGVGVFGSRTKVTPEAEAKNVANAFMKALIDGDEAKARSLLAPDVSVDVADLSAKLKGGRSGGGAPTAARANKLGIEFIVPVGFTGPKDGYTSTMVLGLKRYEGKLLIMKAGENGFIY